MGKSAPNHPGKPLHPSPPYGQCPYGNNTFQKGASLGGVPWYIEVWDIYLQVIVWIVKLITEYTDGILSVYVCLIPVDHCMQSTSTTFCIVLILHIKVIFNRFFEFGTEDVVSAEGNNCL